MVATLVGARVEHGGRAVDVTTPHQGPFDRRPPFVLVEGDREIARVPPHVWDEKPLDMTLMDEDQAGAAAGGVT